jgi:hypothetical protein
VNENFIGSVKEDREREKGSRRDDRIPVFTDLMRGN